MTTEPVRDNIHSLPRTVLKQPDLSSQTTIERTLHELKDFGTYSNSFAPLNCTWGVASRLPITWSGNASDWAYAASQQGYTVSGVPRVGSIAQTSGDSSLGHVGIITALHDDGSFDVWEENYYGLGITDTRTTSVTEFPSFIYF